MNSIVIGERGFIAQHLRKRLDQEPASPDDVLTLFHVAGKFSGPYMLESNINFGAKVLEDARFLNVRRFVNAGTIWGSETLYGASHRAFECIVDYYRSIGIFGGKSDMRCITLRLSNVYGPGQKKLLLPQLIEASKNDITFKINSSPRKLINFVYIDDVIDAFMVAARSGFNDTFTVYGNKWVTMQEFVDAFREFRPLTVEWGTDTKHVPFVPMNGAARLPGWAPKTSLRDGLGRSLQI